MDSIFRRVYVYEQALRDTIFSNQTILKYLVYGTPTPLSGATVKTPSTLEDTQVFFSSPKDYSTVTIAQSMIFFDFVIEDIANSNSFKNVSLLVDIIVPKDFQLVENKQRRLWNLCEQIDLSLNGEAIGVAQTKLYRSISILNVKDCVGRRLVFKLEDFGGLRK